MFRFQNVKNAEEVFAVKGSFPEPKGAACVNGDTVSFHSDSLSITSEYVCHPSGITERTDTVKNISDKPIDIRSALSRFTFDGGEYEVYTQYSQWTGESRGCWQRLNTEIGGHSDSVRINSGMAPFFALYNMQNGRGTAFHIMADSTWKFTVRRNSASTNIRYVTAELGINDCAFSYILGSGESLTLPTVLYYEFRNKTDMDAYKLHRWCNEKLPASSFPVVYNTWMSKFDTISYELLSLQLERAVRLGAEYFVIDAGWFGAPYKWFQSVGDWKECTDDSMRGRMLEFADLVREKGLEFGLWFEIERAAAGSEAVKKYPQYYIKEGDNYFVNYADPEACEYIFDIIAEPIRKYGIRFIKFDFNAELTYDPKGHSFIEYFRGYREFIYRLKREFPDLYLENCASGGMRMTLSNLPGFDSFWISDNHSIYSQLRIFKDTLIRMPSRALETWMTARSMEDFKPVSSGEYTEKVLVSGDAGWGHVEAVHRSFLKGAMAGGPIGISCDLTCLSDAFISDMAEYITKYKAERDFWMKSECHILADTPSMLCLQFCDKEYKRIKIWSFAWEPEQTAIRIYPACDRMGRYRLSDGTAISGEQLESDGISLPVGERFTAEFVEIKSV